MGKVFIIAEAGVNHNGNLKIAQKLIDAAESAGADAIKFQTFRAEDVVTIDAPKATYQNMRSCGKTQFEMIKSLELTQAGFMKLHTHCKKKGIIFLSTPFDIQSARFLKGLNLPYFKISSGDLTNLSLIIEIARYKKPIILSTGMATLAEVKDAVSAVYSTGNKKLILLHCTSNYPANYKDVNLKAIKTLISVFKVPVGYSDHTLGIEVAVAAVAMGACVIEKHFTLKKNMNGPDHHISLEPVEFKMMVEAIRHIEKALGDGIKLPAKSEAEIKKVARKSIVTSCDMPKGCILDLRFLSVKRPGTGIAPVHLNKLIGKRVKFNLKKDSVLKWADIVW